MAKNFWNFVGNLIVFTCLIISITLFSLSIKDATLEAKIALNSFIGASILTIIFAIISHKSKIKDEKIKEFTDGLKSKAEEKDMIAMGEKLESNLNNHILLDEERHKEHQRYDVDRYTEINQLITKTSETVYMIEKWIMEGKIMINKN
jgi:hypothetical protein